MTAAESAGGFRVRFAQPGETVVTLDDIERKLDPGDVLIVDDVATAAIGGVMGAGTTEVRDNTTDVMLEAAVWDPAAVSRTQRRLHLYSEAGRRYERAVDPAISVAALDRAPRCWPRSRAARSSRNSPTGAATRPATTGRSRRSPWPPTCPTGLRAWSTRRARRGGD